MKMEDKARKCIDRLERYRSDYINNPNYQYNDFYTGVAFGLRIAIKVISDIFLDKRKRM